MAYDKTRKYDLEYLREQAKVETDPNARRLIKDAGKRIRQEGKAIADMRQSLMRAQRINNKERRDAEIKDIQHRIEKDYKYRHHKAGY